MRGVLCTSSSAYEFAQSLLRDSPAVFKRQERCIGSCSVEHFPEGVGRGMDHSCSSSHDHSKERDLYERSTPEKYRACTLLREEAKTAFTAGQFHVACRFYERILVQLDYTFPEDDVWKSRFREVELCTHMNLAITRFRLCEYRQSIFHCNRVLSFDDSHVKALVRRGLSHLSLCEYCEAEKDFTRVLEVDPECVSAREHLHILSCMREKSDKSERSLYLAMFGSLDGPSNSRVAEEDSTAEVREA